MFVVLGKCFVFPTIDDMELKCSLCKRLVSKVHKGDMNILPKNDSYCMLYPNETLCKYISGSLKQIQEVKNPKKYCIQIQSCNKKIPKKIYGVRCEACVNLAAHLQKYRNNMEEAFYAYCKTSQSVPLAICGDFIQEGISKVLSLLDEKKNPISFCLAKQYCSKLSSKSQNENDINL